MLLLFLGKLGKVYGQNEGIFTTISLNNLDAFVDPPKNWIISGDAVADYEKTHDLQSIQGTGVVVDDFAKNNQMHLYTKEKFGDVELKLDFMMAKNSNSGVYLQGRYEIQLLDSWTKINPTAYDEGAIYPRRDQQRGSFEGVPPLMNVSRAPGLWQHLDIKFRAPQFDNNGNKIKDARFEEVYLNGVLIQEAANVTGPTTSAMFTDEEATGPLVLQGDHGPVAFKNIQYRRLPPVNDSVAGDNNASYRRRVKNPIYINPQTKNYALRSFMEYGDKKLTHIISIGSTSQVNFAYDLKQGAIFKIWRGQFLDVTDMWVGRGESQLASPLGSVIMLNDAPAVAVLNDQNAPWPDSVSFDDLQDHGYVLNKERDPTFLYTIKGIDVKDSIVCEANGEGILRKISITNPPENVYCRIINGKDITRLGEDLYSVNDKMFYIHIDNKYAPIIRNFPNGKEMIVKINGEQPVEYSFIW